MKLYTSYFYMIRFFKPNMIPLSTALSDPRWYHAGRGRNHIFFDKRHVLNGVRIETLHPDKSCENLCGGKRCKKDPTKCSFLKKYRKQLDKIDFDAFMKWCKKFSKQMAEWLGEDDVDLVFIVHEATDNPCSERVVIQQWFADHGYPIEDWNR